MKMGEIIKSLREKKGITQEELGEVIGVQKSAIRKYEKGEIENIKRSSIKKLADYFNVAPSYLMGWDEEYNKNDELAKEVALIKEIQNKYGNNAVILLQDFNQLNESGQQKAIENISDLTEIQKYINNGTR